MSQLAPAVEVDVTLSGSQPRSRHFVAADEFTLTVLNLTSAPLQPESMRALRDMASQHPEYFVTMFERITAAQDDVRLGRDGLFVAGRKVAELDRVVEKIARGNVKEIRGPVVARGSVPGSILGGWIGFAVGAVPGLGGASEGVAWLVLSAAVGTGAFLGYHWSSHKTEGIVYRDDTMGPGNSD